jgi:hypothetical protein
MRGFEDFYIRRSWAIQDRLPCEVLTDAPDAAVTPEVKSMLYAYLRLSEDESELCATGWISKPAWREWHQGIVTAMQLTTHAQVLKEVCNGGRRISEFSKLRRCVQQGPMAEQHLCLRRQPTLRPARKV